MSKILYGPAGRLVAGFARVPAGMTLVRVHRPDADPAWYGPAVGARGRNRFDIPHRMERSQPGICYFAPILAGALIETVVRDSAHQVYSATSLALTHAVSTATPSRDLVLIDLVQAGWTRFRQQTSDITARPPYDAMQALAEFLSALPLPGADFDDLEDAVTWEWPDGIVYPSRFGAGFECIALWDRAADALRWSAPRRLTDDRDALADACEALGIGLMP